MSQQPSRWSIVAVDARLAQLDPDMAGLAGELGLPVQDVERFARVREVLLTGRAAGGEAGTDLNTQDLCVAGITVKDVLAYQRVGQRILERGRAERSSRAADPQCSRRTAQP